MTNPDVIPLPVVNEIEVRRAQPEDVEAIFTFICMLKEKAFDFGQFRHLYNEALSGDNNFYLVAVEREIPVGFISCYEQILLHRMGKVFEIQELYVNEKHRGKGVGGMLLKSVEEIIQSQPYAALEVSAHIRRTKTHQFYVGCGFEQTHFKFSKSKT